MASNLNSKLENQTSENGMDTSEIPVTQKSES